MHVFNDLEGLRIAAEMEKRGEAFYRNAARVSKRREVVEMLEALADDERRHLREFNRLYEQAQATRDVFAPYDDEANAYLSAIAADIVFPGGLMAMRKQGFDDISAVLDYAIQSEKDSILFYTELSRMSTDAAARDMFTEIARQERGHMQALARQKEGL
jgi:rubrerythrin